MTNWILVGAMGLSLAGVASPTYDYKSHDWGLILDKMDSRDRIRFIDLKTEKVLYSWSPVAIDVFYSESKGVKLKSYPHELMITSWTHGAHGETLRIYDPLLKSRALLYETTSQWAILLNIKDDEIEITRTLEKSESDPTPQKRVIHWRPGPKA